MAGNPAAPFGTLGLTVAGGYLFGPVGVAAGALLGNFLFGSGGGPDIEGPRLGDLSVPGATYGHPIVLGFGVQRIAGQMIWATDIVERKNTRKVGGSLLGGGQKVTEYRYYGNFAVALGEGPASGVLRIWAGEKLIADLTAPAFDGTAGDALRQLIGSSRYRFRVYLGDEDQEPDPLIEAKVEEEQGQEHITPGFRGLVYIVFEELPLDEFGNRLPPITAEVAWAGQDELPERVFDPIPLSESIFPNTLNTAGNGLVNFRLGYRVEFRNGNIQVGGFPGLRRFRLFDAVEDLQIAAGDVSVDGNSCTPMCCNADGDIYCALGSTSSTVVLISWETLREIRRGSGILDAVRDMAATHAYHLAGRSDFLITWGFTGFDDELRIARTDGIIRLIYAADNEDFGISGFIDAVGGLEALGFGETWTTATVSGSASVALIHHRIQHFADSVAGAPVGISHSVYHVAATDVEAGAGTLSSLSAPAYDIEDDAVLFSVRTNTGNPYMVKYTEAAGVVWVTPVPNTSMPRQCRFTNHVLGVYRGGRIFKIDTRSGTIIYDRTGWTGSATPRHFWDGQTGSLLMSDGGIHQFPQRVSKQTVGLGEVVTALCARGGLTGSDLDVTELTDEVRGYGVARQVSLRGSLELLAVAYNFDCVESDHQLRFRKRGRPVSRIIAEAELAPVNDAGELFSETRAQDVDLPVRFTVRYTDEERDGDIGTQTVKRISAPAATMQSRNEATLDLPLTLTPTEAKEVALRQCFRAWAERTNHAWHLAWTHIDIDPGDVVTVALEDGRSLTVRVLKVDIGADLELAWETVVEESSTYDVQAVGGGGLGFRQRIVAPTSMSRLVLADVPLLDDRDDVNRLSSGVYWGMAGIGQPGWAGADLYESTDGAFYALIDEGLQEMAWGITRSAMPDALLPFQTDRDSELSVLMVTGSLSAVTELEMLNGANRALLVKNNGSAEVIAFAEVEAGSNGAYRLSTFLRGLRGTEGETSGHVAGQLLILLDDGALERRAIALDQLGTERAFRAVGRGQALSDVPTRRITPIGRDLMPYAPAQLAYSSPLGAAVDVTLTWVRQTRVGGADWADGWAVPPLSEDAEEYELEFLDSDGEVLRTETGITSSTFVYTTAMHAADGPVAAVRAYQISAQVGRGFPATLAIPTVNVVVEIGEDIAEGQSGSGTSSFAGNDIFAQRYDGTVGHVLSLSAYLGSSASGSMTMTLYADDANEPGALIAETEEKAFAATSSGHWEEFEFASPPVISTDKIWIACHGSASVNSRGSDGTNQNDRRRFKDQPYASGRPDPFGAASSYNNTRGLKMKVQT